MAPSAYTSPSRGQAWTPAQAAAAERRTDSRDRIRYKPRVLAYFSRHWRGQLGLGLTWWVNCVLLTALLVALVPWLAGALGFRSLDTRAGFLVVTGLRTLQLGLVPLWQLVGLWRSAGRALEGPGPLAARAAQVAAVLFTLVIAMRGLVFAGETAIGARLALGVGPYAYRVSLASGGREILVQGGLGFGVAQAVQALLDANPGVRRIQLNSGGGALSEAQALRQLIIARGLDTYTRTGCSSACFSAFIGGRQRILQRGAPMGVHLPRNWDLGSTAPFSNAFMQELVYLRDVGLPGWFLVRWTDSGPRFWYPTEFQLRAAGVVTAVRGTGSNLAAPAPVP